MGTSKILVSQCLFGGDPTRYDGISCPCMEPKFLEWKNEGRLVPCCPEVMGGLSVPREPTERVGDRVITSDGADVTDLFLRGAELSLALAIENEISVAILKDDSPSCGPHFVHDGSFSGCLISGEGVTAEVLRKAGIKVFSESELAEAEAEIEAET